MSKIKTEPLTLSTLQFAKSLWWALAAAGMGYALLFVIIALLRSKYPFELEWMEGAIVDHVRRVTAGLPVYVRPSIDFIPFIYAPIYYYVSAVASAILGEGFLPLRVVSLVSTLANFGLIFLLIRRETKETVYGLIGVGLFAASYRVCGAWFDLARVDSLALLLVLCAAFVLRGGQSTNRLITAGILFAIACLTKQSSLLVGITLGMYLSYSIRWKALWYIASFGIAMLLGNFLFNALTDGWFNYYVYELPSHHTLDLPVLIDFWSVDILAKLPVALAGGLAFCWLARGDSGRNSIWFWAAFLLGSLISSWSTRVFAGGFENALIPLSAALAILSGLLLHRVTMLFQTHRPDYARPILLGIAIAISIQFYLFSYNPVAQLPTEADRTYGKLFIDRIAEVKGDILLPSHGYLPVLAGKKSCAHKMALAEIQAGDSAMCSALDKEIIPQIESRKYAAIILNAEWFTESVTRNYRNVGDPFPDRTMFYPVTGLETRAHYWFVPR